MSSAVAARPGTAEPWRDPAADPFLRIEGVTKRFDGFVALDAVTLPIYRGELFALLGASGSGKSTLLRCLAGFIEPDAGRIVLDGQDLAGVPPYERPINMMFQSYALFPHMTVAQNIGFGLRQEGAPKALIADRVAEMLALVQMEGFGNRKPAALSGGQKARVALARALAKRPKLLLLDEPLSALDKNLREATQFELVNIQERTGTTFVIVTHDQEEAMTMATRLAVMDRGTLAQVGTPGEVYEFPNSRFTAEFLGTANILEGVIEAADDQVTRIGSSELDFDILAEAGALKPIGSRAYVAIRPERMRIERTDPATPLADNRLVGRVRDIAYFGDFFMYYVVLDSGKEIRVSQPNLRRMTARPVDWDDRVAVTWDAEASMVLPE
ncbi:ABC transporter ATP-binding protein [Falsiroseomonas stagni]|uniref:Spermidine/putrescine import ATP-binding protein PotA n=1 Tax=Falsiroseomonas stagni DSM 19981 TaxID=1123062 RepID=A0A1I3ZJ17_9PROT|nr:polyamine ABC transporter ATP-binding protein [Falsiroseomonas stagni]SFK43596.1 putrescine transport system ATP-binding protein [Falsiroseomonas stagni DSM 19981]